MWMFALCLAVTSSSGEVAPVAPVAPAERRVVIYEFPEEDPDEWIDLLGGCWRCKRDHVRRWPGRSGMRRHFMTEMMQMAEDVTHRQPRG